MKRRAAKAAQKGPTMATNPQMDAEQIARISARQMGEAPAPQAAAPTAPPPPKDAPPTDMEKAVEVASPDTEGDKQQQEAVMYNVNIGGKDRNLSPQQISSTFDRYRDLNHRNATNKPVNDLTEKLMRETGATPEQAAKLMDAALRAMTKNVTMGKERPKQDGVAAPDRPQDRAKGSELLNEEWSKYEEENAISLPPGYREQFDRMGRMEKNMGDQLQMMKSVLQQAQNAGQNATDSRADAMDGREEAVMQSIRNNLDRAQQEAGLPDEAVKDFQSYAMERGYTAEDFADAALTNKVIGDFKNQLNTPEFDRLREMASRREAYLTSQSGGPTSQMASSGQDDTLARLAQGANNKRMG